MILELMATWLLVGFVSAVGWNVADETVNKPYLDPYIAKKMGTDNKPVPSTETQDKQLFKQRPFWYSSRFTNSANLCYNLTQENYNGKSYLRISYLTRGQESC